LARSRPAIKFDRFSSGAAFASYLPEVFNREETMKATLIGYVAAAVVMLWLDATWLTMSANVIYRPVLGDTALDNFRPGPAVAFYLLYVCAIVIFAVQPALASGRWTTALVQGALFGFFAYATYDLTNHATLKAWSVQITLPDMAWGTALTAISASAGYFAASRFGS
jgi:uncharacterized membrane protein